MKKPVKVTICRDYVTTDPEKIADALNQASKIISASYHRRIKDETR